jgi:hypothetical protein
MKRSEQLEPTGRRLMADRIHYLRQSHLDGRLMMQSVQGMLEFAETYDGRDVVNIALVADTELGRMLKQLEEEGYVKLGLEPHPNREGFSTLQRLSLTVKGYEHLHTLRQRSGLSRLRKRLADIGWVVITAALTTLLTLYVRGCAGVP